MKLFDVGRANGDGSVSRQILRQQRIRAIDRLEFCSQARFRPAQNAGPVRVRFEGTLPKRRAKEVRPLLPAELFNVGALRPQEDEASSRKVLHVRRWHLVHLGYGNAGFSWRPIFARPYPGLRRSMRVIHEANFMRVRATRHGAMAYPTTDAHVGRSLDHYGEWAEEELQLLGALLKPGDVVIDVGANLGTHSVFFAQKVGPTGAVFAFEPQRVMHQLLCTNATLNGITWLRALHAAVGAQTGALVVPDIDYSSTGNFGGLSLGEWKEGETVPVFTLDGLGLPRCALLKIDVEGMEGQVLDGARQVITACKPVIYLEHNQPQGAPQVIERLLGHEYACFWHFSPFFRADNFAQTKENLFGGLVDANVLAVPRAAASALQALEPVKSPGDTAPAALARRKR